MGDDGRDNEPFTTAERNIADLLRTAYGINGHRMERVNRGMDVQTCNWLASDGINSLFVKEYLSGHSLRDIELSLNLAEFARGCGVPTPTILRTAGGDLFAVQGNSAVAVFEYIGGAETCKNLNFEQTCAAGAALGSIHSGLSRFSTQLESKTSSWNIFRLKWKTKEIDRYLQAIDRMEQPAHFDLLAKDLLEQQKETAHVVPCLLEGLAGLTTQVIHGDYNAQNLLFRGNSLVGVVDFRPPRPFLVAYELGRIALNPVSLQQDGWQRNALATVEHYCTMHRPRQNDVLYCFRVWLIQLLRSTYGIRQHYCCPVPQQPAFDEYWIARRRAAPVILSSLPELETELFGLWERTGR